MKKYHAQLSHRPYNCSFPTPDLAYACVSYSKKNHLPIIIDIRDMWPDVLVERINHKTKNAFSWLLQIFTLPYLFKTKIAFNSATSLIGITDSFVYWGQRLGNRNIKQCSNDIAVYQNKKVANSDAKPSAINKELIEFFTNNNTHDKLVMVCPGNLVPDTDANALFECIENLSKPLSEKLQFVFCGNGSLGPEILKLEQKVRNVKYFSWLDHASLDYLLGKSDFGMLCYLNRKDFRASIPNKVIDYLNAELRIISSISGEINRLLCDEPSRIYNYEQGSVESLTNILSTIIEDMEKNKEKLPLSSSVSSRIDYTSNMNLLRSHIIKQINDF